MMSDTREPDAGQTQDENEPQEPSTEKEADEEQKDVDAHDDDADHEAVGIGVVEIPAEERSPEEAPDRG